MTQNTMFSRFTKFLSQGFSSPELGALAYSSVTLLVTLIGIFRERLLASLVGPGPVLDAYVLAHKIPDVMYATTAALFVSTTLLPHILRETTEGGKRRLMSEMFTVLIVGSTLLAVVLIFLVPILIPLIGPGFSAETQQMAINMSQVILFSPILLGISNLLGINVQMGRRFILVALSPLLYNLGTVITIWLGYDMFGYLVLPGAILIAATLHMIVQLISTRAIGGILPVLVRRVHWKRVLYVLGHAFPRTLTTAVVPVTSLGIISIASHLPSGTVSLLNFGIVIQNVPVTLIGGSLAVASFPLLAELAVSGTRAEFSRRVSQSFRVITALSLPVVALLWLLRREVVDILLSAGQFSAEHAATTASIVGILVLGLWAQSFNLLGARIYYAHDKTWQPFFQNLFGMAIALGSAFASYYIWGPDILRLAGAYVIGWWASAFLLTIRVTRLYCEDSDVRSMIRGIFGSLLSAVVILIVGSLVYDLVSLWQIDGRFVTLIARGFIVGVSGVLAGIGTLTLIGDAEAKMFLGFLRRRLGKNKTL
jgi:putative peptidoglycan lipid II flippase